MVVTLCNSLSKGWRHGAPIAGVGARLIDGANTED
jgi:hypothetical protein